MLKLFLRLYLSILYANLTIFFTELERTLGGTESRFISKVINEKSESKSFWILPINKNNPRFVNYGITFLQLIKVLKYVFN
jgi:hypothetical protein